MEIKQPSDRVKMVPVSSTEEVEQMCDQIIGILIDKVIEKVVAQECNICLEEIHQEHQTTLPCQHKFHKDCLKTWMRIKSNCPLCRLRLDYRYFALKGILVKDTAEYSSDESTISSAREETSSEDESAEDSSTSENSSDESTWDSSDFLSI